MLFVLTSEKISKMKYSFQIDQWDSSKPAKLLDFRILFRLI